MANSVRFLGFRQLSLSKSKTLPIPQPFLKRIWWHFHGFTTIFGILFLLATSLLFFNLYEFSRNLIGLMQPRLPRKYFLSLPVNFLGESGQNLNG
jgi:hypothetical protein